MTIPLTIRIVLLGGLASVVILAFGLRTEAIGFTYATGDGFTLKIDSEAYWNGVPQDGTNGTSDTSPVCVSVKKSTSQAKRSTKVSVS